MVHKHVPPLEKFDFLPELDKGQNRTKMSKILYNYEPVIFLETKS